MLWKQKNLKPYKVLFLQNTSVLPVNRFVQPDLMITQHAAIISWFYVFSCWCQVFNSLEDSSVMKDKKYYRLFFFCVDIECLCTLHILWNFKKQNTGNTVLKISALIYS